MPGSGDQAKDPKTPDKDLPAGRSLPTSAPLASPSPTTTTARVTRHTAAFPVEPHEPSSSQTHDRTRSSPAPATQQESSVGRMTRKRAASLHTRLDSTSNSESAPLSSTAVTGPRSSDPGTQVCLCPPDPKIPRPRNAFMLYRQHHQANIVAQNPGLANPDISKIIGQRWRDESREVRTQWDALADEEKLRHNTAYPGYKYQPRRRGRKNTVTGLQQPATPGTAFEDYPICEKCGKRSLVIPQTPSTGSATTPAFPSARPSISQSPRLLPPMQPTPRLGSAGPSRSSTPGLSSTVSIPGINTSSNHVPNESYTPLSPEAKRRRTSSMASGPYYTTPRPPPHPYEDSPRRLTHAMPPPSGPHDPSLTLAPIQTITQQQNAHARSVQAMVMTISHSNKLHTLSRIAPALQSPGPTSPPHPIRGAIIAVDAEDPEVTFAYARYLQGAFGTSDEFSLQTFDPPADGDSRARSIHAPGSQFQQRHVSDYLSLMSRWHDISRSLVSFITTPVARNGPGAPLLPVAVISGYALSATNDWASVLPIVDQYTPVEHWTWVATLWRGIVGADITVWIRTCGTTEREQYGDVEVRRDLGAAIVRVCEDDDKADRERGRRRLGFEVGELIRTVVRRG